MRIFLACHSYFGKCKVKCPLLIPLLGLMLSMWRSAEDDNFMSLSENMGILQKSPLALRELCILPPYSAEEFQCFLSLPVSQCLWGWKKSLPVVDPVHSRGCVQTPEWSTQAEGAKVSQDAVQAPPAGAHRTSLPGLCSAPRVMLGFTHPHSYRFLGMCLDYTGT